MQAVVNLDEVPVVERQHARAGLFRAQAPLNGQRKTLGRFSARGTRLSILGAPAGELLEIQIPPLAD